MFDQLRCAKCGEKGHLYMWLSEFPSFYCRSCDNDVTGYQRDARETAIYPKHMAVLYPTLGLAGEVGEVAEKVKKIYRDDGGEITKEKRADLAKELGDVLWYLATLAGDLGLDLGDVAEENLKKLRDRAERNRLQGSGDSR